ncbi:MAG: hypothetical protein EKK64_01145 [Neisseriaceae bacterium]|nr:MAG: hypothetical protein EKK64_01145 [Neisseriaceae bacterium]
MSVPTYLSKPYYTEIKEHTITFAEKHHAKFVFTYHFSICEHLLTELKENKIIVHCSDYEHYLKVSPILDMLKVLSKDKTTTDKEKDKYVCRVIARLHPTIKK